MFAYLSKKIHIPHDASLRTIAWNNRQGFVAVGGEHGLLKVLRLEVPPKITSNDAAALEAASQDPNASQFTMNQSLTGHEEELVIRATWNPVHDRLTTADEKGTIIVWALAEPDVEQGTPAVWFEEMVNANKKKSPVANMVWDRAGDRICIAYEDGTLMVGTLDGARLWSKEVGTRLKDVQWSPDGKFLLLATQDGQLHLYEAGGTFMTRIRVAAKKNADEVKEPSVQSISWYNGSNGLPDIGSPSLVVALTNGRVVLLRHERDAEPIALDTHVQEMQVAWSPDGAILAISGRIPMTGESSGKVKYASAVQFYTSFGRHLRTFTIPGHNTAPSGISWDHTSLPGLRLGIVIEQKIYFANIRHEYVWGMMSSEQGDQQETLVYKFKEPVLNSRYNPASPQPLLNMTATQPEETVAFWHFRSARSFYRTFVEVIRLDTFRDAAILAVRSDPNEEYDSFFDHL